MTNKGEFELSVPVTLDEVVKRLEGRRMPMAPRISPCTIAPDSSWFVCTISYGYALASLKGQKSSAASESKVLVQIGSLSIKPLILMTIGFILISVLINIFVLHASTIWDWLFYPLFIIALVANPILLLPFKKQVLDRFVRETVLTPPEN